MNENGSIDEDEWIHKFTREERKAWFAKNRALLTQQGKSIPQELSEEQEKVADEE